jgi:IclR family KDG regulon transcriptional repressor
MLLPGASPMIRTTNADGASVRDAYVVRPVAKAMRVLAFVAESGREVTLSEVARHVGLPKTTVFRYLYTLLQAEFLAHGAARDRYRAGPRLAASVGGAGDLERLRHLALPVMAELGRRFNETVNLGVASQGRVVYVEMIESSRALRMQARIGDRHPLHSTALGKAILAFLPPDRRDALLGVRLDPRTGRTLIDREAIRRHLREVARRGYAIDAGENEEGSMCVGVPILDRAGHPVGALSLSAPEQRMTRGVRGRAVEALLRGAAAISRALAAPRAGR